MCTTERIPGFAICARCAAHRQLGSCPRCGLLVCGDCRRPAECAVCHDERRLALRRAARRARLSELGRRTAVIALVAASGVTGLSAAMLPGSERSPVGLLGAPVPLDLRPEPATMVSTIGAERPLHLPMAWGQPLLFRCFPANEGVTCCVLATPR